MKSHAALAASMIRKHIKAMGVKARVTSELYSGGSAVNVEYTDIRPALHKEIKEYCSQFRRGHFDGSMDMYVYDNTRSDIPQVSYVNCKNIMSVELETLIYKYLKNITDLNICAYDVYAVFEDRWNEYDDFWLTMATV